MKILIVDDNPSNVKLIANLLKQHNIAFAMSGDEALAMMTDEIFDLILLDVMMPPGINGYETCKRLRKLKNYHKTPVIFLTAQNDKDSILEGFNAGGQDYITKPFHSQELISRVTTFLKLKRFEDSLQYKIETAKFSLKDLNQEIIETQKEVLFTLGSIAETRSKETGQHVKRVAKYSYLLAKFSGVDEDTAQLIKMASPMHDIGKIGIPDSILNKPGKLTEDEMTIMKTHSQIGYDMLKHSNRPILAMAADIAHTHHEKYDGSGYPNGLSGDQIPIHGSITALADVFDALGSDRCYKKAWDDVDIFNLLQAEKGKHFNPDLIDLFFKNLPEFLLIRDTYRD